jgi:hypothetical protein
LNEWVGGTAILFFLLTNALLFSALSHVNPLLRWFSNSTMAWNNSKLTIYHGTDTQTLASNPKHAAHAHFHLGQILAFAVDLSLCRPATDFGQGF